MSSNNYKSDQTFCPRVRMTGVEESWNMQGLFTPYASTWTTGTPTTETPYVPISPELEPAAPSSTAGDMGANSDLFNSLLLNLHPFGEGTINLIKRSRREDDGINTHEGSVSSGHYVDRPIAQPVGLSPVFQSRFGELAELVKNGFRDQPSEPPPTRQSSTTWTEVTKNTQPRRSIWNDPSPHDRFVVIQDNYQFSFEKAVFYVEGGRRLSCSYTDPPFSIQINSPSKTPCVVTIESDMEFDYRYICTFDAKHPGMYPGFLKSLVPGNSTDVNGSPFQISVSPRYQDPSRSSKTITTMEKVTTNVAKLWGVCADKSTDKIYIADRELNKILVLNTDGDICFSFGEEGSGPGQFLRPTAIAIDDVNQRLVISDKDNHRITIFKMNGDYISCFGRYGRENGNFKYPWGVDVSQTRGLIVVADSRNRRIQLFNSDKQFLRKFTCEEYIQESLKETNRLDYPRGVVFSRKDPCIYVTDFNVQTLMSVNIEMTRMTTLTRLGDLSRPQGLTVDILGNILVCDSREDCIRVISPEGKVLWTIQESAGSFNRLFDVSVLRDGRLVFVDSRGSVRMY